MLLRENELHDLWLDKVFLVSCGNYHPVIIYAQMERDSSLDTLLLLDGERFVIDEGFG